MLSEVLNALFLTYLVTEYLAETNNPSISLRKAAWQARLLQPVHLVAGGALIVINIIERVSGAAKVASDAVHGLLHLPKILFVAGAYLVALYFDCRRTSPSLKLPDYLARVGWAFLQVLPIYPFLAVAISFGFLLLLNLLDALGIDEHLLNWPIYYGTLYGPFSLVYWKVKRKIVEAKTELPMY